ncbi:MAG TPA: SLBB domain-containing protein [Gemmatimonadaceae bacterium]|nr:SLBB domain-containing protein [Gemmatimonadaceae bacterium]
MRLLSIRRSRLATIIMGAMLVAAWHAFANPNIAVGQTQRDAAPDQVFHVGDRVVISVQGESALTDTFTVREGLVLKLPTLPDINLAGVPRSDVQSRIARAVSEYYRDREVHASTLVRIGILGQVLRPGYYDLSVDATLSDALMVAGGPTAAANPDRIVVRRAGATMYASERVRDMLAGGTTVADAALRSGDELFVQDRQSHDWSQFAQIAATLGSLAISILYAVRR